MQFDINLTLYIKEIFNFLRTCTIKSTFYAEYIKQKTMAERGIVEMLDEDNPYYINMIGEYAPENEPMYITSLDTGQQILFNKQNLDIHVKTHAAYKIPSKRFDELCAKYPNQVDLIKSIIYPVSSINEAIQAENFDLLQYDADLLHPNEKADMVQYLQKILKIIDSRWDVREFDYEEYYYPTLWSIVWYYLVLALFARRITNIRTNKVHSYHIWEYLMSKGLGDYRDVLNYTQELFLYKNINYLRKNGGKQSNLKILADNLLVDFGVVLRAKSILFDTENTTDTCIEKPIIISELLDEETTPLQNSEDGIESIETIVHREYLDELEPEFNEDVIQDQYKRIGKSKYSYLPTKLVELKKQDVDDSYLELYFNFLRDTALMKWSNNDLPLTTMVQLYEGGPQREFTVGEIIALICYCLAKANMVNKGTVLEETVYQVYENDIIENGSVIHEKGEWILEEKQITYTNNQGQSVSTYYVINTYTVDLQAGSKEITIANTAGLIPSMGIVGTDIGKGYRIEEIIENQKIILNKPIENTVASTTIKIGLIKQESINIIPNRCEIRCAYKREFTDRPEYVYTQGQVGLVKPAVKYKVSSLLDVDNIYNEVPPRTNVMYDVDDMLRDMNDQFTVMKRHLDTMRGLSDYPTYLAWVAVYDYMIYRGQIEFTLVPGYETYSEWFSVITVLRDTFESFDNRLDADKAYEELALKLINTLYPTDRSSNIIINGLSEYQYKKMKKLFMQLCSYNIAFLDTDRSTQAYIFEGHTSLYWYEKITKHTFSILEMLYDIQYSDITKGECTYPSLTEYDLFKGKSGNTWEPDITTDGYFETHTKHTWITRSGKSPEYEDKMYITHEWERAYPKLSDNEYLFDFLTKVNENDTLNITVEKNVNPVSWDFNNDEVIFYQNSISYNGYVGDNVKTVTMFFIDSFTNFTKITCSNDKLLGTLDFTEFTALQEIICDNNQIENLILPDTETLVKIKCNDNLISELNVTTSMIKLYELDCSNNGMSQENVSNIIDTLWEIRQYLGANGCTIIINGTNEAPDQDAIDKINGTGPYINDGLTTYGCNVLYTQP